MSQTLTSAEVFHYYQRLADPSTLPFWQLPDIAEPAGPERGHFWHRHGIYPELARSREIAGKAAAVLQRRALILRNPGLARPPAGGPVLATLACLLEGLPARTSTSSIRETASSVMVVPRGTGTLICGGQTFALLPNDLAVIPAWTWHQLTASDHDHVMFRVTHRPIHDAFGL